MASSSGSAASAVAAVDRELHELLSDLGELLCELVGSSDVGPSQLESSGRFWHLYHQLKQRHNESLSVALLALAKSGKSTLVNALLGDELMPVSNVPETARICRVTHAPAAACPAPRLERLPAPSADGAADSASPTAITGAAEINSALRALNAEARGGGGGGGARVHADERLLDITAPLVALEEGDVESGAAAGVAPGTRLCLLDTPGPNEAGEEGLRFQVERLLCGVDAAVYLLDYTKLKTAEEASMLGRLRSLNPELVRRLCTRLFFAVNKFDQAETAGGLGAEETREYVAQEVTRQLALPGFSLHPDQVLIISARDALLSRLILSNRATPDAASRFTRAAFGPVGARSMERQPAAARAEAARSAASDMLRASGVPELEARVLAFLYENSSGLKLMATLDDAGRLLAEVHNAASACCASLAADAEEVAASRDALAAELAAMMGDFDGVARAAEELEVEVVDELRAHLANLRIRLFQHISDAFDERRARTETASGGVAGRWSAVRRQFAALFGGGGAESRDAVGSALLELHDEVTAQIEADVAEAWHVMEAATNARARALAAALNDALERLTLRVEGAVEAQLDVQLEPVSLRMEPPTREAFHADLQALIDNGISEVPERHVRVAERTEMTWELRRRGVCRMSSYWVQVPRTHRVVETYTSVSYNLDPQAVRDQFMQAVDSAILTTERSLPPYVREFVKRQVEAARRQAQDYGDSYLASMRTALEASTAGADVRAAALSRVTAQCDAAAGLRGRLSALAARVETLVPHNASVGMFEQLEWPSEDGEGEETAADARPGAARDQEGTAAAVALAVGAAGGAVAAIAAEVAAAEKQKGPAIGGEEVSNDAAATKDASAPAAAPAGDATSDADVAEAEALGAEEEVPPAPVAAAASSRRASSSGSFGSCAELSTDEVGEARAADLAASGLLAMRPLPVAPSPADEAPAEGPKEEEKEEQKEEEEESAEARRMAGVGEIAALAAAAAAPAVAQQQEEAVVPAPPAPPSSVTDPLSSFEEVLSPTATVVSSGGANERLADSLLGGDASGDASDADAPAVVDPAEAFGVPPALPLSSSAHGSALGGSADGNGSHSLSIVPHSEDGADGVPVDGAGSPTLDFRRSFAEALTAAGLPGVPPPGSTDSSDDWTMVEGVAAELEREGDSSL